MEEEGDPSFNDGLSQQGLREREMGGEEKMEGGTRETLQSTEIILVDCSSHSGTGTQRVRIKRVFIDIIITGLLI